MFRGSNEFKENLLLEAADDRLRAAVTGREVVEMGKSEKNEVKTF